MDQCLMEPGKDRSFIVYRKKKKATRAQRTDVFLSCPVAILGNLLSA